MCIQLYNCGLTSYILENKDIDVAVADNWTTTITEDTVQKAQLVMQYFLDQKFALLPPFVTDDSHDQTQGWYHCCKMSTLSSI